MRGFLIPVQGEQREEDSSLPLGLGRAGRLLLEQGQGFGPGRLVGLPEEIQSQNRGGQLPLLGSRRGR